MFASTSWRPLRTKVQETILDRPQLIKLVLEIIWKLSTSWKVTILSLNQKHRRTSGSQLEIWSFKDNKLQIKLFKKFIDFQQSSIHIWNKLFLYENFAFRSTSFLLQGCSRLMGPGPLVFELHYSKKYFGSPQFLLERRAK